MFPLFFLFFPPYLIYLFFHFNRMDGHTSYSFCFYQINAINQAMFLFKTDITSDFYSSSIILPLLSFVGTVHEYQ